MTKKRFNYGDREQRMRKALERLGADNPKCLLCCCANPLCLELHHPAQHAFAPETIELCSNHHDDASDWQKDHPGKIVGCNSILEPIGHWLLGLGDLCEIAAHEPNAGSFKEFLLYLANALRAFGHQLIKLIGTDAMATEHAP